MKKMISNKTFDVICHKWNPISPWRWDTVIDKMHAHYFFTWRLENKGTVSHKVDQGVQRHVELIDPWEALLNIEMLKYSSRNMNCSPLDSEKGSSWVPLEILSMGSNTPFPVFSSTVWHLGLDLRWRRINLLRHDDEKAYMWGNRWPF